MESVIAKAFVYSSYASKWRGHLSQQGCLSVRLIAQNCYSLSQHTGIKHSVCGPLKTCLGSDMRKHAVGINNEAVLTTTMRIIGSMAFMFNQQYLTCVWYFNLLRWICSCSYHTSRCSEDKNYAGKGKSGKYQQICR